jgi:hypothetical protein
MSLYVDPAIDALIAVLNTDGPVELRNKYFQGDPLLLPNSAMPICFISKDETTILTDSTLEDRHNMVVVLNVVYNFSKDLNQKSFVQAGTVGLYKLCEGRDENMDLLPTSIASVLRKYQVLDSAKKLYIDVGSNQNIDYVLSPPSRRGMYTVEAIMRITLRHHQERI